MLTNSTEQARNNRIFEPEEHENRQNGEQESEDNRQIKPIRNAARQNKQEDGSKGRNANDKEQEMKERPLIRSGVQ